MRRRDTQRTFTFNGYHSGDTRHLASFEVTNAFDDGQQIITIRNNVGTATIDGAQWNVIVVNAGRVSDGDQASQYHRDVALLDVSSDNLFYGYVTSESQNDLDWAKLYETRAPHFVTEDMETSYTPRFVGSTVASSRLGIHGTFVVEASTSSCPTFADTDAELRSDCTGHVGSLQMVAFAVVEHAFYYDHPDLFEVAIYAVVGEDQLGCLIEIYTTVYTDPKVLEIHSNCFRSQPNDYPNVDADLRRAVVGLPVRVPPWVTALGDTEEETDERRR